MATHAEVNKRFVQLDTHPSLLTETFDGWLAWPIVKERLWLACLQQNEAAQSDAVAVGTSLRRLFSGAIQACVTLLAPPAARQALLYETRKALLPDGRAVHPHLGSYPQDPRPLLHCLYGAEREIARHGVLFDHGLSALTAALSWAVRRTLSVTTVSEKLLEAVAPACSEVPAADLRRLIADQLARFRIRLVFFRHVFRRSAVRAVIVLDPDSKVAEIAAAKSLAIPVVEVQHGMFSAREPDYSWSRTHRASAAPLPLPDRVIVFGPLWRDELVRAGYWRADEVVTARSPVIAAYRAARALRAPRNARDPLRLLFATQAYVRDAARALWDEALTLQQARPDPLFHLRIKVHPLEEQSRNEYLRLAAKFPQTCTVVPANVDAFAEIGCADVLAGYTSLMLFEAIGIGVPVISLRGGAAAEGFAAIFDLPKDVTGLEECQSAAELLARLEAIRGENAAGADPGRSSKGAAIFEFDGPDIESVLADC